MLFNRVSGLSKICGANVKTLTRRQFIKTAAAGITVAAAGSRLFAAQMSARQPNIVYIFADQMRAHALGCYGNEIDWNGWQVRILCPYSI